MAFFRLFRVLPILAMFCQVAGCALAAAYPMATVGVATTAATGKGPTDHAISESVDKDCSVWKIFDGQPICERRLKPHEIPVQDYSRRQKLVPAN